MAGTRPELFQTKADWISFRLWGTVLFQVNSITVPCEQDAKPVQFSIVLEKPPWPAQPLFHFEVLRVHVTSPLLRNAVESLFFKPPREKNGSRNREFELSGVESE